MSAPRPLASLAQSATGAAEVVVALPSVGEAAGEQGDTYMKRIYGLMDYFKTNGVVV